MLGPLLSLSLAVAAVPAGAHHSVLGFDSGRAVVLSGIVREVVWRSPHTYISVDRDTGGEIERWVIESESPLVLERLGWTRTSIQPGDRIRSLGAPARDGRRIIRCDYVEPDARRLPATSPGHSSSDGTSLGYDRKTGIAIVRTSVGAGRLVAQDDTAAEMMRLPCMPPGAP